jgi:DNA-binding response OmpR family regulator
MSNSILKAVFEQGEAKKQPLQQSNYADRKTNQPKALPRVFVVDDDPVFCKLIERVGKMAGYELRAFQSLSNLGETDLSGYDVGVVDFDLGCVDGIEMASYLEKELGNVPIVFVSSTDRRRELGSRLESQKAVFVLKQDGPNKILDVCRQSFNR